jgi:hypothetical protein
MEGRRPLSFCFLWFTTIKIYGNLLVITLLF